LRVSLPGHSAGDTTRRFRQLDELSRDFILSQIYSDAADTRRTLTSRSSS